MVTVPAGLHSNPVEFDGIKTGIIEPLPDPEEFHGVSVAQPIADDIVRVVGVLFGDVGQANNILLVMRAVRYSIPLAPGYHGGSSLAGSANTFSIAAGTWRLFTITMYTCSSNQSL